MSTARAVAAEVRARCGVSRMGGRELARRAGFKSHNYLAIRLRDEKPFTLDDLDLIAAVFDTTAAELVAAAVANHGRNGR